MAIEKPKYKILKKDKNIEIREYAGYILAEVQVVGDSYNSAGNTAFRSLADYIFGNNVSSDKISMTAPVSSTKLSEKIAMTVPVSTSKVSNQNYKVSFTMPSKFNMDNLPKPNNSEVKIIKVESFKAVAIRFSGYTNENKIDNKINELRKWAEENKIVLKGEPTINRFDAPWTPGIFRTNEVLFRII